MNQIFFKDIDYYPTFLLLLLSVCLAALTLFLLSKVHQFWCYKTNLIVEEVSDVLSLLLFPSTYEAGLRKLSTIKGYKYFLPLIQYLVIEQRVSGVSLRSSLEQLRIAIHKDVYFENNQRNYLKEAFGQYIIYALLTWGLCWTFSLFGLKLPNFYYIFLFFGQLTGFLGLLFYMAQQQKQMMNIFNSFAPVLYQSLISSDNAMNLLLKEGNLRQGEAQIIRYKNILKDLITRRNTYGVSISAELQLLAQDFWYYWENTWIKTRNSIEKMKFFIVVSIFGGTFMLILWGISRELS